MKTRYKFLRTGLKSEYGDFTWEIGKWYKHEGKVSLCGRGFHCSKEIGQAFGYIQGEILAEVEVRGMCNEGYDNDSWEEMRIIKAWNWNKENSVAISIFSAELCLKNYEDVYPEEKAPRLAIEAAKNWLENPTPENESAARSAAESAESAESAKSAWSAAWSAAKSAAWYARSAAKSAAWSAAESATESAWFAAWSAAESAAWAAESAARSEYAAARSESAAARSARSAALKKIYKRFDEELTILTGYGK